MLCGNTPTCVGKAFAWWNTTASRGKHPHVRGEDSVILLYFLSAFIFTLISKLPQAARGVPCQPPGTIAPSISRLHCRPMLPFSSAAFRQGYARYFPAVADFRQGYALRPLRCCSDGAGAKAIPDARRADGAPQQARTSPGPRGREGSRRRPTRHAADGVQPIQETPFRLPHKGEYGGAGGVEGIFPLSPHAPRRAGDPPPMPGSSRKTGKKASATESAGMSPHMRGEI